MSRDGVELLIVMCGYSRLLRHEWTRGQRGQQTGHLSSRKQGFLRNIRSRNRGREREVGQNFAF